LLIFFESDGFFLANVVNEEMLLTFNKALKDEKYLILKIETLTFALLLINLNLF